MKNLKYGEELHKEYPKTRDPKDFWGQICRTINGKPIGEEQISLIVKQIGEQLNFNEKDRLLDLCCGNGALSVLFLDKIDVCLGIDFSAYLIEVAKENFENESLKFQFEDAVDFCETYLSSNQFNKVLCYGAFAYFNDVKAMRILTNLHERFVNVDTIFIGNLPDRDRADNFYITKELKDKYLDDPQSSIGQWRTKKEFSLLASNCGWIAKVIEMPDDFYAAHYRYDILLTRKKSSM